MNQQPIDIVKKNKKDDSLKEWFEGFQAGFNRAVLITGQIQIDLATEVLGKLMLLEKEVVQGTVKKGTPILLLIDSPGGDVEATYHLKDFIDRMSSPVDGLVVGHAGSMAADLLQMCRRRLMLPNATLFHHFTRCDFEFILRGNTVLERDIRDLMARVQSNHNNRVSLYRERTGMTRKQVYELFRQGEDAGVHIEPREALKMRLIDGVDHDFKFFP